MDYKEKIIKFVKCKDKIIRRNSNSKYINNQDIKGIEEWNEKTCKWVYDKVAWCIRERNANGLELSTCIWCVKYNSICMDCTYGFKHGICNDGENWFNLYNTEKVRKALSNKVYRSIINNGEK